MKLLLCCLVKAKFAHVLAFVCLVNLAFCRGAEMVEPTETTGILVRIGHLQADPEARIGSGVLHAMRQYLLNNPAVKSAMASEGVSDFAVLSTDSHEDLVQRMSQNEFDIAFCTAHDFVSQRGDYEVLFQLRRPRDSYDPRGQRVFHSGVIFVNNRSPLFHAEAPVEMLPELLASSQIAMVGSYSAPGYVYPCLKLAAYTSGTLPRRIRFCGSSEEVVKTVINGLAPMGACDTGAIESVLAAQGLTGQHDQLVRVILQTDPIPASPVVMLPRWLPRTSVLGRAVQDAMRTFFASNPTLPRLEPGNNAKYMDLRQNVDAFNALAR
ncbi:hypothetical protein CVU37_00560 [candidate division BRC1 bacterium HGW-BRC1-1]|jgi:ABC-type phosphate/phosphonate transport system substrate-binding protein|nr:MAG: hypothetical protein CVU37_00560 [candidate division BRC1 bacterium HGW-BRC1-1]